MPKKSPGSSVRARRVRKSARRLPQPPDSQIDFSDLPELTDEQLAEMRPLGRPPVGDATKRLIAFRINPNLLLRLRGLAADLGKPYQTLMHEILERSMARATRRRQSARR